MVKVYVRDIEAGGFLWTNVPALWSKKVQAQLIADGYKLNDDGTVTKLEPNNEE